MSEGVAAAISPGATEHAFNSDELHRADAVLGKRITSIPGISHELPNARLSSATRVISGYYRVTGSNVDVSAVELDAATEKSSKIASVTGPVDRLPWLTVRLAQALGYSTQPPITTSAAALRSYATAIDASDANAAAAQYQSAVAADPAFGAAYIAWARSAAAARDGTEFKRAMEQAAPHAAQFSPFDRGWLAALHAEASGDAAGRIAALKNLERVDPANPLVLRFLGGAELAMGDYADGIAHYERAARATPGDGDLHNVLLYAYLTEGDEGAALRECAEYKKLAEGANPVDSLGDVQFHFNHFDEALKSYLDSYRQDPELDAGGALEKAALSQLLAGDLAKADALHHGSVQNRAARRDATAALNQADWLFLTGRRSEALDVARQFAARAAAIPQLRDAALTRIAAWDLQLGATAEASQSARAAMHPGGGDLAALLEAFTEPLDDAAFNSRVAQLYPGTVNQERRLLAEGYRLFFGRRWDRALPVWKQLAQNPNSQTARAIYAWVLLQNGNKAEAAKMAATTPLWHPNQTDVFSSVWFPRLIAVRAATESGREQQRDARIYKAIGGE